MKIGYCTGYSKEQVEFSKRNGFRSWELFGFGRPEKPYNEELEELRKVMADCQANDIEISCLGCYGNNLSPNPEERKGVNKTFERIIDLVADSGIGMLAGFAGRNPELSVKDNIPVFKEVFTEQARHAEARKVKIAFENCPMFHSHPFRGINIAFTPQAWDLMFSAVPSPALGLEYDPSHLICLLIDPVEVIRRYGKKIFHVHAKDAEVLWQEVRIKGIMEEGVVRHRTPGMGQVNWKEVISALVEQGYQGNLDIEGFHDPVYGGGREQLGLVIGRKHLEQFLPEVK